MSRYTQAIREARERNGALLDALRTLQQIDGYISGEAMTELADAFSLPVAQVYETASFYSMLHMRPVPENTIEVCKNAPCHIAGAAQVIEALEKALGIRVGEATADGKIALRYTECIGQCQSGPSVVVNGRLYGQMTAQKVRDMLSELN